jgi:hypothetical protein
MKTIFTKELLNRERRSEVEQRFIDLTIIGVFPRTWPSYAWGTFTKAQAVASTSEALPWEIDTSDLKWSRYVGARHDPNTVH